MSRQVITPQTEILNIVNWIKTYFINNGSNSKAVIGISGGKDSTISAALLVRALGSENVIGVLMPEGIQSDIDDSIEICNILGIKYLTINIGKTCQSLYTEMKNQSIEIDDRIITNTPARIRMATLYSVAASVGGRVVNTCNYSEDYVGYSTKYGDLAGDFSILKNYTVTEVLSIGEHLKEIPSVLIHKIPSDGMCGKTDEDNLGFSYNILDDYILHGIIPEYDIYKKICERHKQNLHKNCINLPAPSPKI